MDIRTLHKGFSDVDSLTRTGTKSRSGHDVGTFPTYSVYVNGNLVVTYPQSSVADFVAHDQTYQRTPSQIQ